MLQVFKLNSINVYIPANASSYTLFSSLWKDHLISSYETIQIQLLIFNYSVYLCHLNDCDSNIFTTYTKDSQYAPVMIIVNSFQCTLVISLH